VNHVDDLKECLQIDRDFTGENDPRGSELHGTHIAQLIHLLAPKAGIANLKVVPKAKEIDRDMVREAIAFCVAQYPKYPVINLSLYFLPLEQEPCSLCNSVNSAVAQGLVAVAAVGNFGPRPGTVTCPGSSAAAITVGSSLSEKEWKWWEQQSRLKLWWWKFSGEEGERYGTSYSAAYVSAGIALLLSAFPEATPFELKQAMAKSAARIPDPGAGAGLVQFDGALQVLLNRQKYDEAKQALYLNSNNELAQRSDSPYLRSQLGRALSFIEYALIPSENRAAALKELTQIRDWLVPGAFVPYRTRITNLMAQVGSA
jgi:hypothetical protein